jgi:hypothetical protein
MHGIHGIETFFIILRAHLNSKMDSFYQQIGLKFEE